jgi:hypothetical protein
MTGWRVNRAAPAAAIVLALSAAGCGGQGPAPEDQREDEVADARAEAQADLSGTTYQDVADTSACTEDCSGHDAGYQWAQENEITDPDDCDGNNDSFLEGCRAYGEELERRADNAVGEAKPR